MTSTLQSRTTRLVARGIAASAVAGVALLALGGPALAATPAGPLPTLTAGQQQDMLAKHNAARTAVGVGALTWDAKLAADAQAWADHLGRDLGGKLVHSEGTGQGENLYSHSAAGSDPSAGVDSGWPSDPTTPLRRTRPTTTPRPTPRPRASGTGRRSSGRTPPRSGAAPRPALRRRHRLPVRAAGQLPGPAALPGRRQGHAHDAAEAGREPGGLRLQPAGPRRHRLLRRRARARRA